MASKGKHPQTPLMEQYHRIKAQHAGALLLFRVGDFYETFEEDARKLHDITDVKLTKRSNGSAAAVALAGFPHHALDIYLPKLIRAGLRVAICDQLEPPQKGKDVVARAVTELVTPGLSYHDEILEKRSNNYLASIHFTKETLGVAFLDLSTGEFSTTQGTQDYILKLLQSFQPAEIIFNKKYRTTFTELLQDQYHHYMLEDWIYDHRYAYNQLNTHLGTTTLKGFGIEDLPLGIVAAGAILRYLEETEHRHLQHINTINRIEEGKYVWLDKFTVRNLELLAAQQEQGVPLIDILDKTITPMGARKLRKWLTLPLKELTSIQKRLDNVAALVARQPLLDTLTTQLKQMGDLERLISKVAARRINPRELLALKRSMQLLQPIQQALQATGAPPLQTLATRLYPCDKLATRIHQTLKDHPPLLTNQGGMIKSGVSPMLDNLHALATRGSQHIEEIQEAERKKTGIPSLKVGYNRVFGYYLEVRNTHKAKVPPHWIRKQTLVDAERYITQELKEREEQILTAQQQINALEQQYYDQLVEWLAAFTPHIQQNSKIIAQLDCYRSFAQAAIEYHYTQPHLHEDLSIDIKEGRHPVIERHLPPDHPYQPNDVYLAPSEQQIMLVTGPNMSGKSSFLRQVPLIVLMAQIGSFVPAKKASIGLVDKIFSRVGASDNLAKHESTFMVEMNEMANILHNLSAKSLVIVDELGRGTGTVDGLALAQSILEYLHHHPTHPAKTLFATHYHELAQLASTLPRLKNYKVEVKQVDGKVFFLHKLLPGNSEQSFGAHVARMAGIPTPIIERAFEILQSQKSAPYNPPPPPNPAPAEKQEQKAIAPLLEALNHLDLYTLTPIEALLKLQELKSLLEKAPPKPH